tara:strand:- start:4 stop:1608 length:1605 start_codon:yes stop_codon:yes gene_type:complete
MASSSSTNPSTGALNSPRTVEACLRLGHDPAGLVYRGQDEFLDSLVADSRLRQKLAKVQFDHHEEARKRRLQEVFRKREEIIDSGEFQPNAKDGAKKSISHTGGIEDAADAAEREMLAREAQRMEKMKFKQRMEIRKLMEYEMMVGNIQAETERKLRRDQELNKRRRMREMRKQREIMARKAEKIEQKHQQEVEERLQVARQMKRAFEKQQIEKKKLDREERQRRALARQREQEMNRRAREHQEEIERRAKEEEQKAIDRMNDIEKKAIARKQRMRIRQRQHAEKVHRKMAESQARIDGAMKKNERAREEQTMLFHKKSAALEHRQKQQQYAKEQEQHLHSRELEEKVAIRQQKLEASRAREAERRARLINMLEGQERKVKAHMEGEEEKQAVKRLTNAMQRRDRAEKIEQLKRIDDYEKMKAHRAMLERDRRTKAMLEAKRRLVGQRKATAQKALIRKHHLYKDIAKARRNGHWKQLEKKLASTMDNDSPTGAASPSPMKAKKKKGKLPQVKRAGSNGGAGGQATTMVLTRTG